MSRKKKRDYMKTKVNKLEENSKNKNIREMYKGINEFKKGNQPRAYVIKKHDSTIAADTTSILSRWEQFLLIYWMLIKVLATKGAKYTLQSQTSQSLVL